MIWRIEAFGFGFSNTYSVFSGKFFYLLISFYAHLRGYRCIQVWRGVDFMLVLILVSGLFIFNVS